MERTLITWSVPNMITIWLMLFIGFLALALVAQVGMRLSASKGSAPADNSGGY